MWERLKAAALSRYALPCVLALAVTHTTALGLGYMKGSKHAENAHRAAMADQLQEVVTRAEKLKPLDTRIVATVAGVKEGVKHEIQSVPGTDLCGPDGLRAFNQVVEAITRHTGAAAD